MLGQPKAARRGIVGAWIVFASCCGSAGPFAAEAPSPATFPVLTNAQQVRLLSREEAARGYPVRLQAIVTYYEPKWNTLFVQDETGGVFVFPSERPRPDLQAGQWVELEGKSVRTTGPAPNAVLERNLTVRGTRALPPPVPVSFNELISGQPDANLVQLQGYARVLWYEQQRMEIDLAVDGGKVRVHLPWPRGQALPEEWLHTRMSVIGVAGLELDDKNPEHVAGARVFAPDRSAISILRGADAVAAPLRGEPLRAVARHTPQHISYPRQAVSGVVTLQWPSSRVIIQDASGGLELELGHPRGLLTPTGWTLPQFQHEPLQLGQRIEAVGYPAWRDSAVILEDVEVRAVGKPAALAAIRVSASDLTSGEYACRLVEVDARLNGYFQSALAQGGTYRVLVQSGEVSFEAQLPAEAGVPEWPVGSNLRLTGVCSVTYDAARHPRTFQLLLRGPADLVVLSVPRWWSSGPVPRVLGAAAICSGLALAWVGLLRRQVRQRTAQLSATAENLRQSEERFSKAFQANSAILAILDAADGRYLHVNDAFLNTYGFAREEVLGRTSLELGLWQDPAERAKAYQLYARQGCLRDFESHLRTRDGESKVVLQSGDFITVGQRSCILSVAIDITERKRAEADLRRNLEREKELHQLKSSFVSMVSHEFRTPLEVIVSSTDILERYLDRLKPEQRTKHLGSIQSSVKRMARMMEEVLLLGRLDASQMPFVPDDLHLPAWCRRIVDEMHSATNNRCPIELTTGSFAPMVQADERLLRHILTNLLSNAIKYSPPGTPVQFSVERARQDAVFMVRDHGLGIPAADQARLFEAFHRGSNAGQVPGTGLGLVIVKRCLDLHGGAIEYTTAEGAGTTFTVRIPLFTDSEPPADQSP